MVVTKREFQDVIEQMNTILTKLDERIKELEAKPKTTQKKTTTKTTEES